MRNTTPFASIAIGAGLSLLLLLASAGAAAGAGDEGPSAAAAQSLPARPLDSGTHARVLPAAPQAPADRGAELAEVRAILEAARRRVHELSERAARLPRGAERDAALRAASAAKQQAELDALRARERHARARGDDIVAEQIARAIRSRLEPRASAPLSRASKAPDAPRAGGGR